MSDHVKHRNPHRGSSLADLLKEDGTYQEVSARATMRAVSANFKQKFEDRRITRTDFAKRMGSSRSAVNRLLDGNADSVTLKTLVKAAAALGMEITFGLSERASLAPVSRRNSESKTVEKSTGSEAVSLAPVGRCKPL